MKHVVGISEMKLSTDEEDILVTYALGSCIGLTLLDPREGIGGMIHCFLPLSQTDPEKAKLCPWMFADTGVAAMLESMLELGAAKERMIASVAGGSNVMDSQGTFRIGERNYTVVRKILWKNDILIAAEDVGGTVSRTMFLHMADGRTTVQTGGVEEELV